MTKPTLPLLRNMPRELRVFALLTMTVLAIGYSHALVYVFVTTHAVPKGIEERYRGSADWHAAQAPTDSTLASGGVGIDLSDSIVTQPPAKSTSVTGELQSEKSLAEMLNMVHTHVLTMSLIFFVSGIITFMTGVTSRKLRVFIVIEPFFGIIVTFLGLWLTRYVHPAFSWLVAVSGMLMAFAFFMQYVTVLREFFAKPAGLPR